MITFIDIARWMLVGVGVIMFSMVISFIFQGRRDTFRDLVLRAFFIIAVLALIAGIIWAGVSLANEA